MVQCFQHTAVDRRTDLQIGPNMPAVGGPLHGSVQCRYVGNSHRARLHAGDDDCCQDSGCGCCGGKGQAPGLQLKDPGTLSLLRRTRQSVHHRVDELLTLGGELCHGVRHESILRPCLLLFRHTQEAVRPQAVGCKFDVSLVARQQFTQFGEVRFIKLAFKVVRPEDCEPFFSIHDGPTSPVILPSMQSRSFLRSFHNCFFTAATERPERSAITSSGMHSS